MATLRLYDASLYANVRQFGFISIYKYSKIQKLIKHLFSRDSRRCLRYLAFMGHRNHFVFTGDARIRQLYKSFVSQFIVDGRASDLIELPENSDLSFNDAQLRLKVQFLWRPQVNPAMVADFRKWMVIIQILMTSYY